MRDTPFRDKRSRFLAGVFGLRLFLVSLGILFVSGIIAFVFVRLLLEERGVWPRDLPSLPALLWLSTTILLISSMTLQMGLNCVRHDRLARAKPLLVITLLLGICFLLVQARCWLQWMEPVSQRWYESDEYRFALTAFYILTGMHALHVIGGLIPMAMVARNAMEGQYDSSHYNTVQYVTTYWHFLGLVWLLLYATLWFGM